MKRFLFITIFSLTFLFSFGQQKLQLNNQFTGLELNGALDVELIEDTVCRIDVSLHGVDAQKLTWKQNGDFFSITLPSGILDRGGVVELKIHVKNLKYLVCNGCKVYSTSPLSSESLSIFSQSSNNLVDLDLDAVELRVEAAANSKITIKGSAENAFIKVIGAKVDALNAVFKNCTVKTSMGGEAIVNVTRSMNANAATKSTIYYKGNPESTLKTTLGGGIIPIPKVD